MLTNKLYLYLTEFFAGMTVMAVELGASRLLAPYFSSSQIVWTIIIGTIMIAMALGNLYGGRTADRDPDLDRLYRRILLAAIWIAAIPCVGKYVIAGVAGLLIVTVSHGFLVLAAFVCCMLIFVFPLFLLGTVTPSLARYTMDSLDNSGKVIGRLNAFNTIGSIIGTFVPTFVSIPAVGTAVTFLIFAGILLVLCIISYLTKDRDGDKKIPRTIRGKVVTGILLFLICCLFGHDSSFAFWEPDLTYEGESVYNYLQVYEDPQEVVLSTNVLFGVQSVYRKDDALTGMYYDYALAAPFMAGVKEKASFDMLILGNGSGTYAKQCRDFFDDISVTGVEIDEKITDLAEKFFALPEETDVVTYDGRAFLNSVERKYDVILVDAYQDITIPFQMSSIEFFSLVKEHLDPDGVLVVNLNMRSDSPQDINAYLSDTIAAVFPHVYTADVQGYTNRELFAANADILPAFYRNLQMEERGDLTAMIQMVGERLTPYERGGLLLTDDRAPVELLGMQVIDGMISEELGYYRELFREKGIRGALETLL